MTDKLHGLVDATNVIKFPEARAAAERSGTWPVDAKVATITPIVDDYPATPELDKLAELQRSGQRDTVQDFLDWLLDERDFDLVRFDSQSNVVEMNPGRADLLADYFGIDLKQVDREGAAVLAYVQRKNREES